jgi:hypothetical protein
LEGNTRHEQPNSKSENLNICKTKKIIIPSVLFKFMDMGISVIPWQFGSFPVAQTRGLPRILKQYERNDISLPLSTS